MTLLGVYVGNDSNQLNNFEKWLGRDVDLIHAVVGSANWTDFTESAKWMAERLWNGNGTDLFWSVPMITNGASLYDAASGAYNNYYRQVAQTMAKEADAGEPIYVRTGWEFNGSWFPWNAIGREQTFIDAFRQMVNTFRSVSDKFKFEWNVNESYGGMDPAKAYPGDGYVDVIGMDFYWNTKFADKDPAKAWNNLVNEKYGLQWHADFAAAHGKPMAYSEWGVMTDAASPFLKAAKNWFDGHNVAYQVYWDSDSSFPGKLSDYSDPTSGATYRSLFSGGNTSNGGNTGSAPAPVQSPSVSTGDSGSGARASGAPAKQFWGSTGKDNWWGTDGNDDYSSRGGGDTMNGGKGDDTYRISTADDRVVEKAGEGVDTVVTWISSYTLPDHVENLTFTGTSWSNGTGNWLDNIIIGNDSPNRLDGAGGNDILTGGGGRDVFVIGKGQGRDIITDFRSGEDRLELKGFGNGASLWQDGSTWHIKAADGSITDVVLQNGAALKGGDYYWA